jgi:mRNA interferase RelE/StbE
LAWRIDFAETAEKQLSKLDHQVRRRILRYLRERVVDSDDPRSLGAPLRSNLAGLWKYRIGDYRVIAEIQDEIVRILVVRIGHRRDVYRGH